MDGRDRESIAKDLESTDEEIRRMAVERLTLLPSAEAIPVLVERLGDSSWRVRKAAIDRLADSAECSETTRRLCVGEIEQSAGRYDFELDQVGYERIAGAKTASLYAAACELGARYPGANEELGELMRGFGYELGLAFQIVDDCLDLMGDEARVGKSVGTDVADGKVTLAVLRTYASANEATRDRIRDRITLMRCLRKSRMTAVTKWRARSLIPMTACPGRRSWSIRTPPRVLCAPPKKRPGSTPRWARCLSCF